VHALQPGAINDTSSVHGGIAHPLNVYLTGSYSTIELYPCKKYKKLVLQKIRTEYMHKISDKDMVVVTPALHIVYMYFNTIKEQNTRAGYDLTILTK
jgi:hypothetical protein